MSYNPDQIRSEFDEYGLREWERLVANPIEEIGLHVHTVLLERFVRPGMRVLEIGAGPGRFTQVLARLGARVLVSDISPVQLELNRRKAAEHGFAAAVSAWEEVDMCDLSRYADASFDMVLAYGGPFSYVLDHRSQALAECMRVLQPGGVLLMSVMSLWGTIHFALKGVMETDPEFNRRIIASGDISPETFPRGRKYMHLFRSAELRDWLTNAGLTVEAMSATRALSTGWGELGDELRSSPDRWAELLAMEVEACAEPGALDMGTHIIAAARKE